MTTTLHNNAEDPVDILLIGLGSIGSIYAYLLERSGRARVTAVARSNYDLYTKTGVTLDTGRFGKRLNWKPHRVVKSQAEALSGNTKYAYCLITTKCLPDVLPTTELLKDSITSGKIGAWSLIQNGLEVESELYGAVKDLDTPIISSCAWIGIMTSPDGAVVSWQGEDALVSGIYPPLAPLGQEQTRQFSEKEKTSLKVWHGLLKDGGANIWVEDRIDSIRFAKNIWNCAWSSIEGLIRATPNVYGPLPASIHAPLKSFIREIVSTGFKSGLIYEGMTQYPGQTKMGSEEVVAKFAWDIIVNMSVKKYNEGLPPHKMSLLIDVEMGRPIEVEVITGAVLRVAQKLGLETPLLEFTYALMKGVQSDILLKQGKKIGTKVGGEA